MPEGLSADKSGLKAALAESVRSDDPVPGSAAGVRQLALLPLRQVVADEGGAEPDLSPRGAGRPKGAKNKSTLEWREYLLGRYSSPLVALAETYSRSVHDLAKEFGFWRDGPLPADPANPQPHEKRRPSPGELLELFKVQLQCAKELGPYVHQKQPLAIDGNGAGLINLIIQQGVATAQQVETAGVMSLDFVDAEPEQIQRVSGDQAGNSDVSHSDVSTQSLDSNGENNG